MVAFGEQRDRYANAAELQMYAGIAPVTESSGKQHWVHWRMQCPNFLRQTFVEWAALTIPHSFWANAYYRQQRAKGCAHQAALRALAFKWVRILYRCWSTRTPAQASWITATFNTGGNNNFKKQLTTISGHKAVVHLHDYCRAVCQANIAELATHPIRGNGLASQSAPLN